MLDYPIYSCPPLDDHLGDGQKILNTTSARPGLAWGGFFVPSQPSRVGGCIPTPSSNFPPLVWPPMASRRHFYAHVQQGRGEAKTQTRRKGHLKARHGALSPHGCPYIPAQQNGP